VDDRYANLAGHGVFRDLHVADAGVPEGGEIPGRHVRPGGERQPAVMIASRRNRMIRRTWWVLTLACLVAWSGTAVARNPHCAGGIQYVSQGMRDKDKGNTEDYSREMNKAVQQLVTCAQEDPKDLEALGYLGWAYAELDSAKQAGDAFKTAIDGLTARGDVKTRDLVVNNRDSYYARYFNAGIERISAAQTAYPDMTKK